MRRRIVVSMIAALLAGGPLYAQAGQISGSVTSAEGGRALSGATVQVVGSQARAVTGPDGRYTISGVAAGPQRVTATVIGHTPATLPVTVAAGQTATLDFELSTSAISLEGVVAIGYGERRIRDVTGSVEAVGEEEFNTGRVVSPEQLIRGKVPGVQVVESGEPGGGVAIRIRGGTSVNASNDPLFVLDGVPLEFGGGLSAGRNPLNFINPQDITSITVLKDAASTAIYGSRGANGVIIIETRSGTRGGPQFSYSNSFSTSRVTGELDMLDPAQFRSVVGGFAPGLVQFLGSSDTDWRGAVQRDAAGQEHGIGMAGSGEAMSYRLSLNHLTQDGVLRGTTTERLSAAINYSHRLFEDRLSLRASLRGARTEDQFTPGGVIGAATTFDPTQPMRTGAGAWFEVDDTRFDLAPNNPLAELALAVDEGTTYRGVGSLEARYRMPFLEALSGTVRVGFDVGESERRGFRPSILQGEIENPASCDREEGDPPCPTGTVSRSNPSEAKGLVDAFLTYAGAVDRLDGDVEATVGYSYETFNGEYPFWVARGLESDLLGTDGVPTAVEVTPRISVNNSKLASFFGRLNYTFRDRYLLTLSVRRDGSSKFGPLNQWGTFPAAAVGWRIGEEAFMDRFDWISDLKLRASWGVNGNQAIPSYLWVASYTYSDAFARVQFGDQFVTTIRPSAVDPAIKWEETTSYNVGFDYGLFDNRITGSVEYYDKDTDDLLFRIPVAAGTNLSNYLFTNVGSVNNRGLEIGLNAEILRGGGDGLRWNASFNASTNRNRLISINPVAGSDQLKVGGIAGGVGSTIQVLRPGQPINSFFVFHHLRDASGRPVYGDTNGDGDTTSIDLYEDVNNDGKINDDDLQTFHSPTPQWILSHTSSLGYRRLDLSFTLRASLGNYVYNNVASSQGFLNVLLGASGPVNLHRSVLENGFVESQYFSDIYVEDASFLRMDNVTLGYTLPRLRGLSDARVFGTVQNAFTLTGYDGLDPESGLGGIDNNIYPRSRTFTVGLSVGF